MRHRDVVETAGALRALWPPVRATARSSDRPCERPPVRATARANAWPLARPPAPARVADRGLPAPSQLAGTLLLAELSVRVVGHMRVAGGVQGRGLGCRQLHLGRTQVGLELVQRARPEDGRGDGG